jgi:hypothetical protein
VASSKLCALDQSLLYKKSASLICWENAVHDIVKTAVNKQNIFFIQGLFSLLNVKQNKKPIAIKANLLDRYGRLLA